LETGLHNKLHFLYQILIQYFGENNLSNSGFLPFGFPKPLELSLTTLFAQKTRKKHGDLNTSNNIIFAVQLVAAKYPPSEKYVKRKLEI